MSDKNQNPEAQAVATVVLTGERYAHDNFIEVQLQKAEGVDFPIGTKFYLHPSPAVAQSAPVCWLRHLPDGRPDWAEDCVSDGSEPLDADQIADGYTLRPLIYGDTIPAVAQDGDLFQQLRHDYWELIYAVDNKYPGESRHQTALRYIRQAEAPTGEAADAALSAQERRS